MCTETFLRLPEEKKNRVLEAAWTAFASAPFAQVSINGIIRRAGIPRGSFYQYFAGKEDLFAYLLGEVQKQCLAGYHRLLLQADGDLFRLQLLAYDTLMERADAGGDTWLSRFLRILRINPGVDLEKMMLFPIFQEQMQEQEGWQDVDTSRLRRKDPEYLCRLVVLLLMSLGSNVMFGLAHPDRRAECRRDLEERLQIIQYGSAVCPEPVK